jgi:hypothetical protein
VKLLLSIKQVVMIIVHRLQVLDFALLEIGISFIPTSHRHHHLVVCTRHVIVSSVVVRVMILFRITVFIAHMVLLHLMMVLLAEVLLLLVEGLGDDSVGVKVHS